MEKYNKKIGFFGEGCAEKYLKKNKYAILEKNFYIRGGEIDIIAQKDEYIVFVEVKTRTVERFGSPAQAVTYFKRQRMIRAARVFLQRHGNAYARFDIIEVFVKAAGEKFSLDRINHIENAFISD